MSDERLRFVIEMQNKASAELRKLSKEMSGVKQTPGMSSAASWFQKLEAASTSTSKALRPLSSGLANISTGGLAAGLSVAGLVQQFRDLARAAPALQELSRQTGLTKTQIERLKYAGKDLNIDPSKMTASLDYFSGQMVQIHRQTGTLYAEMQNGSAALAEKIRGEDPASAYKDMLRWLAAIPEAQIRAGKSAADAAQIQKYWIGQALGDEGMSPLLSKGMAGFDEAMADAQKNVAEVTDSLIEQANALNRSVNAFDQSWRNFETSVGPAVFDNLRHATDDFREVFKEIEGAVSWFDKHKEHPVEDAGKGALDAIDSQARYNQEHPKGIILDVPSIVSKVVHGVIDERPTALRPNPLAPSPFHPDDDRLTRSRASDAPNRALDTFVVGALEKPILHLSGTLKTAAFHPAALGASLAVSDPVTMLAAGVKLGVVQALRELQGETGDSDGAGGSGSGGGFTKAAFHPAGGMLGGRSAAAAGRSEGGSSRGAPLGQGAVGGVFKGGRGAVAGLAKESYDFWRGKGLDHNAALSMVAQEEGESGFDYRQQRGDSGLAHGAFSWHPDRRALIRAQTGINIDSATHLQQLEAAWHEGTKGARAGFFQSLNGRDLRDAVYQGVHRFEGSKYQMKDTASRLGMARKWDGGGSFLAPKPTAPDAVPAIPPASAIPSAAAIGDAAVMAARKRLATGGGDPADRALIARYLKQQNAPKHARGGSIHGPGGPRSDSIPAWLSNGEFVVHAAAAHRYLPLLHAINGDALPGYASGGLVSLGVPKQFYPRSSPSISAAEGADNRRFYREFMLRSLKNGGMGAPHHVMLGALAMMQGESGRGLNSKLYGWDVNGPSGGIDQLHDVTVGRGAGRLRRLSDEMTFAMRMHADWTDREIQAANFKKEALESMNFAWRRMLAAKTARAALRQGINLFENPADHPGEFRKREPNIARLEREERNEPQRVEMDPLHIHITNHEGRTRVSVKHGEGVRLNLRTAPTMIPTRQ